MKRCAFASLMAVLALAGSGCSSISNPFAQKPDPKTIPAELVSIAHPALSPRTLWQSSIGGAGSYVFSPAVVDNSVYAAAEDGNLVRYDNGKQVWRISTGQSLSGGVGADEKTVVVGTFKGEVLAYSAENGKALWKSRVSSEVLAAPSIAQGQVLVRSGDSQITAFDPVDGKRRWVYQRSMPSLNLRSAVGVTVVPGGVLAGFPGGKLIAISINNGAEIWEATVAQPKGATELERVADITSVPVVSDGEVCAVAYQGRVACFELASGNALWSRETSSINGLDIDGKAVYVSSDSGNVIALDKTSGASLWKQDKLLNRGLSRPLVIGSTLAIGDFQGYVHLLRTEDGAFLGRAQTDGSNIATDLRRLGDGLLVQTKNGGLHALSLE